MQKTYSTRDGDRDILQEKAVKPEILSDYFAKLYVVVDRLNERFPSGNKPFQIVARLCEEAGELAKAVNHFEGTGVKLQKHGEPDKTALAAEIQDVILTALCIARYYHVEQELKDSIDKDYQK